MDDSDAVRRHSNPSGLDFIQSSSNSVEPLTAASAREFAAQALLTSATRARYWQAETLTLWQACALYCYLDPDVLGAPTLARIEYLRQVARGLPPDDNLPSFCCSLDVIAQGDTAPPLLQVNDNWFESTTNVLAFGGHLHALGFHVTEPLGVSYHLRIPEEFRWLHLTIEAYLNFWDVGKRGFGGDPRNETIAQFVRIRGGSGALCNAITRVLRPDGARRGRPRKAGSMRLSGVLTPVFWNTVEQFAVNTN